MPFQEIADFQEPIRLHNAHPEDTIREGDAVVLVLGLAGSGKSTFINTIFGQEIAKVGHDLDPGTTVPEYYTLRRGHPKNPTERHIHIIDTPGLDAGYVESAEALTAIRDWLVKRFQ
ncbi:hypothetical protein H0H81_008314 [Sphagnurus paluster]|uniref:G domain-containing protein n=1 Tax=Sphagnurus paluster TaxID=117069 RepID=A0A9P7GRE3_9AGAR|nr:hypothetical protein H0H81_008314 [Sphagnurus paluster]